ncbi:MAG: methionyl-tRNA formyltransferase [Saprospiraceae bacterium]|nr:methionyl-tRNA formyltransferase [Saprospiraceae bacterium]
MRIVFMGTPDFAVAALDKLIKAKKNIVGVITATDKFGGRGGKKLIQSSVKKYALEHDLNVLQPKNLKAPDFIKELKDLNADLQVVVAFRMLPEVVWSMPNRGTFNLHGSLLPQYRGAAPINWAVMNGEQVTGVTTFFLQHAIDTGDIISQKNLPIGADDTAGIVHDKMMHLGADLILETVEAIEKETVSSIPQDDSLVSEAPKIFKETCEINLNQSIKKVYDFVRGLSPFPTAWTTLDSKMLKIYACSKVLKERADGTSDFETDGKSYLHLWAEDGYLDITDLQIQGKKRMIIRDFLNGYTFN